MEAALPMDARPPTAPLDADEALLLRWARERDRVALGELFARHADAAFALAWRRLGHASDAEDAVQAAFLSAMGAARSYRGGNVRGWLLACVLNACRMQSRGAARRRAYEQASAAPRSPEGEPGEQGDLAETVRAGLSRLPEHQRQPIELRFLAGLDFTAIAESLRRPEKTVRGQVDRGLGRLRAELGRLGFAGGTEAGLALLMASGAPPTPAALSAQLHRLAGSGAAPTVGVAALWWSVGAAALAVAATAWIWAPTWRDPAADPPPPAATPVEQALARPIDIALHHESFNLALIAVMQRLPVRPGFELAVPEHTLPEPWTGLSWPEAGGPAGPAPVGSIIASIARQMGLRTATSGDVVVLWKPLPAGTEGLAPASGIADDVQALRSAIIAWNGAPPRDAAERQRWQNELPGPSSEANLGPIAGLRGDPAVAAAVRSLLGASEPWPPAATLAGRLRVDGCFDRLSAIAAAGMPVVARAAALDALGSLRDRRALPMIEAVAASRVDTGRVQIGNLREAAIPALARLGGADAVATLERIASDPDDALMARCRAIGALGTIDSDDARAAMRRHLGCEQEEHLVAASIQACERARDAASCQELERLAQGPDRDIAYRAAAALAIVGDAPAAGRLLDELAHLPADIARDRAADAMRALAAITDLRMLDLLAPQLSGADDGMTKMAARALADSRIPGADAVFLSAMTSVPNQARRDLLACVAAGSRVDALALAALDRVGAGDPAKALIEAFASGFEHPRSEPVLAVARDHALHHRDARVRAAMFSYLSHGDQVSIPGIADLGRWAMRHEPMPIVRAAAIGCLDDPADVAAVIRGDPSAYVRAVATRCRVERMSAPADCAAIVLAVRDDGDVRVRAGAMLTCARIPIHDREALLLERLRSEPDPDLRALAAWCLVLTGNQSEPSPAVRAGLGVAGSDAEARVREAAAFALHPSQDRQLPVPGWGTGVLRWCVPPPVADGGQAFVLGQSWEFDFVSPDLLPDEERPTPMDGSG